LPQPVDLRGHAIALPDAPSPAPDVRVGSPQTWRVPVRQFLDHLCQHRIRLLVTDDIQAELELISKDPNQSGVAARRGPSSSTVYVSSARVREIADRMAVPSAVLRAEIREDPGLFGEHVPSSGRSLKWLALAPPASAWILDRAPVNHALQLVSPSAESVQVAQFALQEWQTYLISMHNDFAPYRDRAGSIVFSNALLAHLRVSRDRPTCGLGARQLLNHLQAYGVDGQLRDAGLVLSITDVPSNT
jgi:hypothetical protein